MPDGVVPARSGRDTRPVTCWAVQPPGAHHGRDFRNAIPRFAADARAANQVMVDLLARIAERRDATPAQVALAWLLAQKPWIVPIPGTRKLARLDENLAAADLELTATDLKEIETASAAITVQGVACGRGGPARSGRRRPASARWAAMLPARGPGVPRPTVWGMSLRS
jgi:hypothetical protein